MQSSMYEAMIQIVAEDQIGVLAAISMALADMKVSISQINTQALKDGVGINIVVGCRNVSHYECHQTHSGALCPPVLLSSH